MEKQRIHLGYLLLSLTLLVCFSCEKPAADNGEDNGQSTDDMVELTVNISNFKQVAFTTQRHSEKRAIAELCNRIDVAILQDKNKVKGINQTSNDKDFGHFSLSLPKGSYTILIIAHNGLGTATLTNPEAVTFEKNKVTDTFYYCNAITLNGNQTINADMQRAVAAFCLEVNDTTPSNVRQMKFYYTGGSSTLNARSGTGCVKSRQTEVLNVPDGAHTGKSAYTIYTFPREDSEELKIVVTALDENGKDIFSKTFEHVPITLRQKSIYSGRFFNGDSGDGGDSFIIRGDDVWTEHHSTY